ncbi:MAG: hypothetical protein M3Y85_01765, partial [Bacteroidota bacterium]|nr:hypothetical protein [Bacteroidota bacterium]
MAVFILFGSASFATNDRYYFVRLPNYKTHFRKHNYHKYYFKAVEKLPHRNGSAARRRPICVSGNPGQKNLFSFPYL